MTKATTQTIHTNLRSTPTITVPANFTALHLAHISWNLYSSYAPTHYENEFTCVEGGDFSMYGIDDSKDISEHFYDCAFYIGNLVRDNVDYSVQDAFEMLDEISADTSVREEVSSTLAHTIQQFVSSEDYDKYTQYIQNDYAVLVEENTSALPQQIAVLEKQLASLKAQA
jgi:hypothetical protein